MSTSWLEENLRQASKIHSRISQQLKAATQRPKLHMTKIKKSAKNELLKKIAPQLSSFDILGRLGEKKVSKKQMLALLKKKNYRLLKKDGINEIFIRKTWFNRNKTLLSPKTNDFSVVILQKALGSEGLIDTSPESGGLYDGGNVKSFNELYKAISKNR